MKKALTTIGILIALAILGGGILAGCQHNSYYTGPVSDHFDGEKFFNPNQTPPIPEANSEEDRQAGQPRSTFSFLRWRLFSDDRRDWPDGFFPSKPTDIPPKRVMGKELRVTMVGHATILIQTEGLNILTDPIWSKRASPVSFLGPKRHQPAGIAWQDLPPIDIVLISHNHYDHLDRATIERLQEDFAPRFITPLGNDTIVRSIDTKVKVDGLDWWQSISVSDKVTVTPVPVQHWSRRQLYDRNHALWSGFVIASEGGAVYFGGDQGYGDGQNFTSVKEKLGPIRLAIVGIGAFQPRWFMKTMHMGPDEGIAMYKELGAAYGMGMHYGVFALGGDGPTEAPDEAIKARDEAGIAADRFRLLDVGEAWLVPTLDYSS